MKKGIIKDNYKLVWSEQFTQPILDTNKWNIEIRNKGWVNNELQAYTDKRNNIYIENNNLIINGVKEGYNDAQFTSGRINTLNKFSWKYGKFEIKAKVPMIKGSWPAIWLLSNSIEDKGWPDCGEIDIMEHINNEDNIYGTIHTKEYNHTTGSQIGEKVVVPNLSTNFQFFGIEWNSEKIIWLINNKPFHQINKKDYFKNTWPFDEKFFLIINQAIGGSWPGAPDSTFNSTKFIIDWIKIYQ
jgi:beta-glucanase (GH16 family)